MRLEDIRDTTEYRVIRLSRVCHRLGILISIREYWLTGKQATCRTCCSPSFKVSAVQCLVPSTRDDSGDQYVQATRVHVTVNPPWLGNVWTESSEVRNRGFQWLHLGPTNLLKSFKFFFIINNVIRFQKQLHCSVWMFILSCCMNDVVKLIIG